jgi:hypothetical protein
MRWYEQMIEKAKSIIRNGDPLHPVLFLKSGKEIAVIPLGRFSDNKEVLATVLHMIVQLVNPDAYMYMTEAYMKEVDTKDAGDSALGSLLVGGALQVSQLPSAKEAITILLGNRTSEKLGVIVFHRKESSINFEPTRWLEGDELKGRFTGLRGGEPNVAYDPVT